jgi:hypothetical protein
MKAIGTLEISREGIAKAPKRNYQLRRSVALSAALIPILIFSSATDAALYAAGVFPPLGQPMAGALFLLSLSYRVVYGAACCHWIVRLLVSGRATQCAAAFGVIGLAASTVIPVVMWDGGPAWYSLAVIAIVLPCACLGDSNQCGSPDVHNESMLSI